MAKTLTTAKAKAFYDRFGAKQDKQGFYEDIALDALVAQLDFSNVGSVFEFGCGTGRFAERLLRDHLPESATYVGIDLSETMRNLATDRLAPWSERATILETNGAGDFGGAHGPFDLIVSTYVFDLLSEHDLRDTLCALRTMLSDGGKLGSVGLTDGATLASKVVTAGWKLAFRINPAWLGGCRPLQIESYLKPGDWTVEHRSTATAWCLTSEVVVLKPVLPAAD